MDGRVRFDAASHTQGLAPKTGARGGICGERAGGDLLPAALLLLLFSPFATMAACVKSRGQQPRAPLGMASRAGSIWCCWVATKGIGVVDDGTVDKLPTRTRCGSRGDLL